MDKRTIIYESPLVELLMQILWCTCLACLVLKCRFCEKPSSMLLQACINNLRSAIIACFYSSLYGSQTYEICFKLWYIWHIYFKQCTDVTMVWVSTCIVVGCILVFVLATHHDLTLTRSVLHAMLVSTLARQISIDTAPNRWVCIRVWFQGGMNRCRSSWL